MDRVETIFSVYDANAALNKFPAHMPSIRCKAWAQSDSMCKNGVYQHMLTVR